MRSATQPLDPTARAAADDEFYRAHPEMIRADGTRVPLRLTDPAQAPLREEWMNAYVANGGKVRSVPPLPARVPQAKVSQKAAASAFGSAGVASPRVGCSGSPGPTPRAAIASAPTAPPPPPKPKTPPPPPVPPACRLIKFEVACEHAMVNGGKRLAKDGLLEVVQHSLASFGDTISATVNVQRGCGQHPTWTIEGGTEEQGIGREAAFNARAVLENDSSWELDSFKEFLRYQRLTPKSYRVRFASCTGAAQLVEVRAYPFQEKSRDFALPQVFFSGFGDGIGSWLRKVGGEFLSIKKDKDAEPDVELKLTQAWKEHDSSHFAYCSQTLSITAWSWKPDPLRVPLLTPPGMQAVQEHIRVGVYLLFGLEFAVGGEVERRFFPSRSAKQVEWRRVDGSAKLEGYVSVAAELFLMSPKVLEASVAGKVTLGCKADFGVDGGVLRAEGRITFTPLAIVLTLKAAWGFINRERTYNVFRQFESDPKRISIVDFNA